MSTKVLEAWQELAFEMITAVREFYMPSTTHDERLAPDFIRQLGNERNALRVELERVKASEARKKVLLVEIEREIDSNGEYVCCPEWRTHYVADHANTCRLAAELKEVSDE